MWLSLVEWVDLHPYLATLILTVLFEAVTAFGRLGCDFQATRDTKVIGIFTRGWRIHHCYVGTVVGGFGFALVDPAQTLVFCVGVALVASDLAHHFLVLWPLTGSPEFHIRYPSRESACH